MQKVVVSRRNFIVASFCVVALLSLPSSASAQSDGALSKVFTPDTIGPGNVSTITFTITNSGAAPITGVQFTDVLPVVPGAMIIADPGNASTTCDLGASGSLSAPDGGGTIALSEAQLGAGVMCTVTVDVTASTPGVHTNPAIMLEYNELGGDPPTSSPVDLTVVTTLPGFSKSFAPSSVPLGDRSTLTFTVDNTANASAVVNLDFTDNLPAGMLVADPANASTDCNSPNPALITTLTSVPGTSAIILDANGLGFGGLEVLPAGATCTVTVDVTTIGAGMLDNVTQDLLATGVSCGKASDTLDVTVTAIALQKSFTDDPVAPGGTATLDFTIDNFDRNYSATGVAFTDDLTTAVAGLTFDSLLSNDCGGSVAGVGTTLITFTGGTVGAQGTCTISVTLTVPAGTASGIYTNTTGTVSGTVNGSPVVGNMASDDLYVEFAPLLAKEFLADGTFLPDPVINAGDDVVLRFTVTNTSTTSMATDVEFLDELTDGSAGLPPDLTSGFLPFPVTVTLPPVPDPPCGAGSSLALVSRGTERQALELTGGSLAASPGPGDSCSFDVTLSIPSDFTPGIHLNTTEEPTATVDGATRVGSPASDTLTVISAPTLSKEFTDDPVAPGDTVTLEFTLSYPPDASGDATVISFTDDLAPVLAGLTANLPSTPDPPCGVGSSLTGSAGDTLLTLLGGTLSPGESCAFSVTLDVPAGAAPGSYTNTTSGVSATVAGEAATSAPASDDLDIQGLTFTKEFLGDPVVPGDAVPLRFTIENTHPTEDATDIDFTDNLAAVLPGVPDLSATLPPVTNTCGGADSGGPTSLNYAGGSLLTGLTCTIEYDVLVPAGAADGTYLNVTSNLTATQGGAVTVDPATDDLTVNSNLLYLTKEFTDDPVAPGGTVTLEFNLTNLDAGQAASAIGFTDDLNVTLTGLTFDSVLLNTCGGTVVGTGTTLITVSGASLAASGTCTIQASLSVPGGAAANVYTNTTSDVTGTIGGFPVSGDAASDDLEITQLLEFSKSFDGPTTATGMATLTFTITNPGANTATDISFSDNLDAVITGLVATSLPALPCGAGSSITGIGFLTFTGGELPPTGGTCSFDVDVLVPATATAGTFLNTTSDLEQAGLYVADPATADLVIEPPPTFAKSFAPNPIVAGAISTLTFTIDNSLSALDASALDFTDNLPAGVVVATPSGASTTCTGGTLTAAAGTGTITYTGGTVGAGATCTVTVDTAGIVPGGHLNTTEDLTSSSGNSGPASDTLTVTAPPPPTFAKVFTPDTIAIGGISTLTFTIDNTTALVPATRLAFTDNLPVAVQIATPNNAGTTCTGGTLTATAGTSVITYSGGTVAAIATCTVSVDVTSSTPGTHVNLSGNLTSSSGTSGTATDNLVVVPVPGFSKVFAPNPVPFNGTSVLTFTIDNTGSVLDATALDFTDNFPAGMTIATPSNAGSTCTGGTVIAVAGSGVVSYSGGTVAASTVCTVVVDVIGGAVGDLVNTCGDLTSSSGNSGPATDTLTVVEVPIFSKVFAPDQVALDGISTLTFTIDNSGGVIDATALDFTDTFPFGIYVATPSNAATTCTGGTLTATPDSDTVSYTGGTVAAGATCTVTVDVVGGQSGDLDNVSGDLTSSLGNSGPATDTLTVYLPPTFTKEFDVEFMGVGEIATITFTIDNTGSAVDATGLDFTDTFPAGMEVAAVPNPFTSCAGGAITAPAGATSISFTGGTVAAGSTCIVQIDITITASGRYVNTTEDLTSSAGNSGSASAILQAQAAIPTNTPLGIAILIAILGTLGVWQLRRWS